MNDSLATIKEFYDERNVNITLPLINWNLEMEYALAAEKPSFNILMISVYILLFPIGIYINLFTNKK